MGFSYKKEESLGFSFVCVVFVLLFVVFVQWLLRRFVSHSQFSSIILSTQNCLFFFGRFVSIPFMLLVIMATSRK